GHRTFRERRLGGIRRGRRARLVCRPDERRVDASKIMSAEIRRPLFRHVVGDAVEIERLATGFEFTEGPIWHPREKHLTFSDMPGDHMRRWTPAGGVSTFRKPCNMANGNTYDRHGRMLTCEHATSRVIRAELDGSISVLATHYKGRQLNSPNDVVARSD